MDLQHPMRVVARRTGLSPHVIRVWEKRYRVVTPTRTGTNRRKYSEGEIERLRMLREATRLGHSIGDVAGLPEEKLRTLVGGVGTVEAAPVASAAPASKPNGTAYVLEALEAVRRMDERALDAVLGSAAVQLGLSGMLNDLVVPFTQKVGELWEAGDLTVAHEHFASNVLRTFLGNVSRPYALSDAAPRIIVATPAGQLHELGAVIVGAAASNKGWRVIYLGTSLPSTEIAGAAIQNRARAVALSIVYPQDDPALRAELIKLRQHLPVDVSILAGGRAVGAYRDALAGIAATILPDIAEFHRKLDALREGNRS